MLHKDGALVMALNNPEPVKQVIPKHKHITYKGKELVLVKHDLDSTKVLRNIGLNAPSPMLHDGYSWPPIMGIHAPMSHQVQTADFATVNNKLFILNATGTGKTGSAIWALEYLILRGYIKRILIVCPLSVIKVWQDELFATIPNRSIGVMIGKKEKRLAILDSDCEICIINFDGVSALYSNDKKKNKKHSYLKDRFDLVIVDEASAYRNGNTDRYEALKYINTPQLRLWLMTGTPTPNAPTDAWALTRLVSPSRVPSSFNLFRETVMMPAGPYKWVPKLGWKDVVRQAMQPAIRFEKKDCLDLPPITYNDRYCEMSTEQMRLFEDMRKKLKHEDEDSGVAVSAANAAVKLLKMQQICCGVVKDDDKNPVYLNAKNRLNLVVELVEQTDNKVIIFVPFIFSMELLHQHLLDAGITADVVNGTVPKAERDRIFDAFQRTDKPKVLIAHPKVAAHGLTLTAADTIIWYAPIYSLEEYEQANARIERKGQKNVMSIFHIICHPFEAAIYQVLQKKGSIQSALLNLYREFIA